MAYQREQEEPDLSKETIFVGKRRALGIGALRVQTLSEPLAVIHWEKRPSRGEEAIRAS
jgi:hypothetical protein